MTQGGRLLALRCLEFEMLSRKNAGLSLLAMIFTLVVFAIALTLEFNRLTRKPWPPKAFSNVEMHFKYGSIGAEVRGYPYLIWRELPVLFADRIPRGFADFGFLQEAGQELPIGISVRRYDVNRVGFNCATCHTAGVTVAGQRRIIYGAPASQLDLQAYLRFLIDASSDPRLTADAVFESATRHGRPFNSANRAIFRYLVFPRLSSEIEGLRASLGWMSTRPNHGPGRTDAGNFWRSRWGLNPERDEIVGVVDHPSVWNQRARLTGWFHWDGNNASLDERNISAALAGGAEEWLLERQSIKRVSNWLLDLKPPVFPGAVDQSLAAEGKSLYARERCGQCHDVGGARMGQVTPLNEIGTDPDRANIFDERMVTFFDKVGSRYSWRFHNYRDTDGYVNMPLDGIWMRAPYLHNGSVPTLGDLLMPAAQRPRTFFRGCEDFDLVNLGFACRSGSAFETAGRGNSNSGHEYGVRLSNREKSALLEFLKTL